jgi:asparagine synthase (glutamine-hydrolysing)
MKIECINNSGKSWQKIGESYVKGFAFIENKLLSGQDLFDELVQSIKNNRLNKTLLELNGNFSVVIEYQKIIYLLADKLKTYPLLYSKINNEWIITDQSKVIMDAMPRYSPNENAIMTYVALGYLHGNQTFLTDCKIVSAGTYVQLVDNSTIYEYHKHIYEKVNISDKEIMEGCVRTLENAIKRMIVSIGNRPIWIPLSGGYDSRLLACVCKKFNVKNVSCFTYGVPDSYEVKISKKVAETLGFPWYYIEYNESKFLSVVKSPVDKDYTYWAMNLNTTSHFQDFIAFKELREKGLIEDNAVIVPGHSGEILGRDQVPYHLLDSKRNVAELLYHRYFQWNILKKKYKKQVLINLGTELNSTIAKDDKTITGDLFSNWNIQNRQANYIVNAVRVYEYFGIDWRIPLWDDELSEFWFSLDWNKNSDVILYNKFMFEKYFVPMGVAIYKEKGTTRNLMAKIRLPFSIKSRIKKAMCHLKYFKSKYDYNGFFYRVNFYSGELKKFSTKYITLKKPDTNALVALYQIFLLEKYFHNRNK